MELFTTVYKSSTSINDFKKKLRNFLIDKNIHIAVTEY